MPENDRLEQLKALVSNFSANIAEYKNGQYDESNTRTDFEVTKLSLYLKLLENESGESTGKLFKYSDMTLLLSLEDNIKCGNSLIGTDFYLQPDLELTDDDRIKVNCFDWEKEFGHLIDKEYLTTNHTNKHEILNVIF